jgi:3-oxoadipate enol-lactonase / 4-carboxymuconolactone decarboxylase
VSIPRIVGTDFGGDGELLLLGPSLGTSAGTLWSAAAQRLTQRARVVGWDLPGHGASPAPGGFGIPELAAAVLALADEIAPGAAFHYAGDSIGGAVGLQLLLDAPERVKSATLLCTGAVIGVPRTGRHGRRRCGHPVPAPWSTSPHNDGSAPDSPTAGPTTPPRC